MVLARRVFLVATAALLVFVAGSQETTRAQSSSHGFVVPTAAPPIPTPPPVRHAATHPHPKAIAKHTPAPRRAAERPHPTAPAQRQFAAPASPQTAPQAPAIAEPAPPPGPVRIAVLTDFSGLYAKVSGQGALTAVKMAAADFGGAVLGHPIVVEAYDHQNDPGIAVQQARKALADGAQFFVDLSNSGIALSVEDVLRTEHRIAIATNAASSDLTGKNCSKYFYAYSFDAYSLVAPTVSAVAGLGTRRTWYAVVPDYAFGHQMGTALTTALGNFGATEVGQVLVPLGATDYSEVLSRVRDAHPAVIAPLVGPLGMVDIFKQIKAMGLNSSSLMAGGLVYQSDVDANADALAGLFLTTSWYWDYDAATQAWANRFAANSGGVRPTDIQAADYSATRQWLDAVRAVGTTNADAVVAYLDGRTFSDFYARNAQWRAGDHRVVHDMYVVQVLPQNQFAAPHAWFKVVDTVAPARAFRAATESGCNKTW